MSAPTRRSLTPLSNEAIEAAVPRLRGRSPIAPDELLLSVLVPVYNEENTIRIIIEQVKSVPIRTQIICVNDCSTDGSRAILDRLHEAGMIKSGPRRIISKGTNWSFLNELKHELKT